MVTASDLFLFLLFLFLLFFFLLFLVFFFCSCFFLSILLTLWCFWVPCLLAWPLSEPLGQFLGWPLLELSLLLLPGGLEPLCPQHLCSSLIQLLPVPVGPGVCPPLVLGEHVDRGRVGASEGLGVKTLLDGLVSQLQLLSLLQLFELVVLVELPLLIVVLLCLQSQDGLEDLVSLGPQLVRVHVVK